MTEQEVAEGTPRMMAQESIVKGTEACQGELTIEDGSLGNGFIDADGAQARGVKGVSVAQNVQLVGHSDLAEFQSIGAEVQFGTVVGSNGLMVSGGIAGAGTQLGAAEDFGSGTVRAGPGATAEDAKPSNWGNMSKAQRRNWEKARLRLRLKQDGK